MAIQTFLSAIIGKVANHFETALDGATDFQTEMYHSLFKLYLPELRPAWRLEWVSERTDLDLDQLRGLTLKYKSKFICNNLSRTKINLPVWKAEIEIASEWHASLIKGYSNKFYEETSRMERVFPSERCHGNNSQYAQIRATLILSEDLYFFTSSDCCIKKKVSGRFPIVKQQAALHFPQCNLLRVFLQNPIFSFLGSGFPWYQQYFASQHVSNSWIDRVSRKLLAEHGSLSARCILHL